MAGATIKEIQELAGHKTITMSARYAHLSPYHKLSVIERIAATATETATTTATRTATRTATSKKQPLSRNGFRTCKNLSVNCSAGLLTGCTGGFLAARWDVCGSGGPHDSCSGERRYKIRYLRISS